MDTKDFLVELLDRARSCIQETLPGIIDEEINYNEPSPEYQKYVYYLALTLRDVISVAEKIREKNGTSDNLGIMFFLNDALVEIERRWPKHARDLQE